MNHRTIVHPEKQPLLVIRAWQICACYPNKCAAMLLSHLEYWHNIKIAQEHGKSKTEFSKNKFETFLQYHSTSDLQAAIFFIFGKEAIADAIQKLIELRFISIHQNPYSKMDRTRHFLFHSEIVNDWITKNRSEIQAFCDQYKIIGAFSENRLTKNEFPGLDSQNSVDAALDNGETVNTETSTKISSEPSPTHSNDKENTAGEFDEFWTIQIPQSLEANRDALVAACRKHRRSAYEMRAAAISAATYFKADSYAAIAIAKLKDPHWSAPPIKINDSKSKNQNVLPTQPDKEVARKNIADAKMAVENAMTASSRRELERKNRC